MYELKLYGFLEKQYFALIKEGLLQLEINWDAKPKPIKMKSCDYKFYSLMIAQYCGGCTKIYAPKTKSGTQKMILDFFRICQKYEEDLEEYYRSHGYATLFTDAPDDVRHEAAEESKMSMLAFRFRLTSNLPVKSQYKLLKQLEGVILK